MPILRIPTPLRTYTAGLADVTVNGATAGQAVE